MPYAWIIIVILWSVINAINKSKKKQAQAKQQNEQAQSRQKTAEQYARQQAQRPAPVKPAPAPQPAAPAMSRQDDWDDEEENWDERDAQRLRPSVTPQAAPVKRHETKPLEAHMHTPVMDVEGEGTEGIDCCHEYMLDQPAAPPADFLPMQEETEALRAKALLQGVIFSEVLGRRYPKRYGPRRA